MICSSTAQSRSPAIAMAVLLKYFKIDFHAALELIKKKVPTADIGRTYIASLKRIFSLA